MTLQEFNEINWHRGNDSITQKAIDAIMTRTSVRQYTDEPLTDHLWAWKIISREA